MSEHFVSRCTLYRESDGHYWGVDIHLDSRDLGTAHEHLQIVQQFLKALGFKLAVLGIVGAEYHDRDQSIQVYLGEKPILKSNFADEMVESFFKFLHGDPNA